MHVTALHRYPVKSMLGEALNACRLGPVGVLGDRAYAVVDEQTGAVASAKVPRRWGDLLRFRARYVSEPSGDGPTPPVEITFPDGTMHRSDAADIDTRLSAALGRDVRLAGAPAATEHFEELWPDIDGLAPQQFIDDTASRREETGEVVSRIRLALFAPGAGYVDLSPLHVLHAATLRRLGELAPTATFDVRRYRPNLLLDGDEPGFVENGWPGQAIKFTGGTRIAPSLATMRCVMTTLAQGELPTDAVTLRTIAKHNRVDIPDFGTWACAGTYADVVDAGEVHLGDSCAVV